MKNLSKFISVTHRRSQIFYTEHLEKLGIKGVQFMYIVSICETPGQTQDELSHKLIIDKSTVTKFLSQLESDEFITKKVSPTDKRAFNIFPTDKAINIYPKIIAIQEECHHRLMKNLSELECDILERLMEKVMENSMEYRN